MTCLFSYMIELVSNMTGLILNRMTSNLCFFMLRLGANEISNNLLKSPIYLVTFTLFNQIEIVIAEGVYIYYKDNLTDSFLPDCTI